MSTHAYPPVTEHLSDPETAREEGRRKMEWALQHMPILNALREAFVAEQPLAGETVAMAMHVEAKTANLVELLADGGATVAITGCNPLSTHDDVSAALDAHDAITSYAVRGVDEEAYYDAMHAVVAHEPTITVDDGMDMVKLVDDGRSPPARDGRRRRAPLSGVRGERHADEAALRQRPRDG
jgi:adenosylhomocysteinase